MRDNSVMTVAFLLLYAGGLIGAIDQVYFHVYRFKLHRLPLVVWEHAAHVARDATYLLLFLAMNVVASGTWWWLYPTVAGLHIINAMVDTMIEPQTRKSLGGVPAGEYRMHGAIIMFEGLALGVMMWAARGYRTLDDGVAWAPIRLPSLLAVVPYMALALAVGFFAHDAFHLGRTLLGRARRSSARSPSASASLSR